MINSVGVLLAGGEGEMFYSCMNRKRHMEIVWVRGLVGQYIKLIFKLMSADKIHLPKIN